MKSNNLEILFISRNFSWNISAIECKFNFGQKIVQCWKYFDACAKHYCTVLIEQYEYIPGSTWVIGKTKTSNWLSSGNIFGCLNGLL